MVFEFEQDGSIREPRLILKNRVFKTYGLLSNWTDLVFIDNENSAKEISFVVAKKDGNKNCRLWDELKDWRVIYVPELEENFLITVSYTDDEQQFKTVNGVTLGEAELSKEKIYNMEVNTATDVETSDLPTVFYRDLGSAIEGSDQYEKLVRSSLLHRIFNYAPYYKIGNVPTSLRNETRVFSISESSIYDFLVGELSTQFGCAVKINSLTRTVDFYDLCDVCTNCGYRGTDLEVCPECGGTSFNVYGEYNGLYIDVENLGDDIVEECLVDEYFNCLRIQAGDDLMTATLMNMNPNGSQYVYSSALDPDCSSELQNRMKTYNERYDYYANDYTFNISSSSQFNNLCSKYNANKYASYKVDEDGNQVLTNNNFQGLNPPVRKGYASGTQALYDLYDLQLFIQSGCMPSGNTYVRTIQEEAQRITSSNLSPISIEGYDKNTSERVVQNAIKQWAKMWVSTSRFDLEVTQTSYSYNETSSVGTWKGYVTLTDVADETITAKSASLTIEVNEDYENFMKQKSSKLLASDEDSDADIIKALTDSSVSSSQFSSKLQLYSYNWLENFYNGIEECILILQTQEDTDLELYDLYKSRLTLVGNERDTKGSELDTLETVAEQLDNEIAHIRQELDLHDYLGQELWEEFYIYRRETTYENQNYISDGLTNSELIERAKELVEAATKEMRKISVRAYSINCSLKNLLIGAGIDLSKWDASKFKCGSWLRIGVRDSLAEDPTIFKLKLESYTVDFNSIDTIQVSFSNAKLANTKSTSTDSVLQQSISMSNSYSYTAQKATKGKEAYRIVADWVEKGLDATKTKILNNMDRQEMVQDNMGILMRQYDELYEDYNPKQMRLTSNVIAMTDDNWDSIKTAVGHFAYVNPLTGEETEAWGVNAEMLVGKLIMGEALGIYNANNSMTFDSSGLNITNGTNTFTVNPENAELFKITSNNNGEEIFVLTTDGDAVLTGGLNVKDEKDMTRIFFGKDDNGQFNGYILNENGEELFNVSGACVNGANLSNYVSINEQGVSIRQHGSAFSSLFSADELGFYYNNTKVAYINHNSLQVPTTAQVGSLVIANNGNEDFKFRWTVRDNGHLSLMVNAAAIEFGEE